MKKLYNFFPLSVVALSFFLLVSPSSAQQKYTYDPGKTITGTWNGVDYLDMNLYIRNTSNSDLELTWRRIANDFPESWDYSLCDNGNCYPGIPEGATFSTIGSGSEAFLKITVGPTMDSPTGIVRFGISEAGSSVEDTVTFIVGAPTSVSEEVESRIRLFPNPVEDKLSLQIPPSISFVKVINSLGEVVSTIKGNEATSTIDFNSFAAGTYMVVFVDKQSNSVIRKIQKY